MFHIRLDMWHVKQDNTHPITGIARRGWESSKGENSKKTTQSTQQSNWIQTRVAISPSSKMTYLSLQSDIVAKSMCFHHRKSFTLNRFPLPFAFPLSLFGNVFRFSLCVPRKVTIIRKYGVKGLSLSNDNVYISNPLIILDVSDTVENLDVMNE